MFPGNRTTHPVTRKLFQPDRIAQFSGKLCTLFEIALQLLTPDQWIFGIGDCLCTEHPIKVEISQSKMIVNLMTKIVRKSLLRSTILKKSAFGDTTASISDKSD